MLAFLISFFTIAIAVVIAFLYLPLLLWLLLLVAAVAAYLWWRRWWNAPQPGWLFYRDSEGRLNAAEGRSPRQMDELQRRIDGAHRA